MCVCVCVGGGGGGGGATGLLNSSGSRGFLLVLKNYPFSKLFVAL